MPRSVGHANWSRSATHRAGKNRVPVFVRSTICRSPADLREKSRPVILQRIVDANRSTDLQIRRAVVKRRLRATPLKPERIQAHCPKQRALARHVGPTNHQKTLVLSSSNRSGRTLGPGAADALTPPLRKWPRAPAIAGSARSKQVFQRPVSRTRRALRTLQQRSSQAAISGPDCRRQFSKAIASCSCQSSSGRMHAHQDVIR